METRKVGGTDTTSAAKRCTCHRDALCSSSSVDVCGDCGELLIG